MLLYVQSCFAEDGEERALVALLSLSSWCLVIVVWLFLSVPWVCLQFVIVILPDHTHLLFLMSRANSDGFGEWSNLRLRRNSKFSCGGSTAICCGQRRLWRVCTFVQAYLSLRHCTKFIVLSKMAICVLLTPAANTLVSLHICAGKVTGQCDKYQDLLCCQRRLLGVYTFAQARLSLRQSIEI